MRLIWREARAQFNPCQSAAVWLLYGAKTRTTRGRLRDGKLHLATKIAIGIGCAQAVNEEKSMTTFTLQKGKKTRSGPTLMAVGGANAPLVQAR